MKPFLCGIYLLFDGDECVYVGQSTDIWRRISEHSHGHAKACKKEFDSWEYIEVQSEQKRLQMETVLIRALKPKYNKDYTPRAMKLYPHENKAKKKHTMFAEFFAMLSTCLDAIPPEWLDELFNVEKGTFKKAAQSEFGYLYPPVFTRAWLEENYPTLYEAYLKGKPTYDFQEKYVIN